MTISQTAADAFDNLQAQILAKPNNKLTEPFLRSLATLVDFGQTQENDSSRINQHRRLAQNVVRNVVNYVFNSARFGDAYLSIVLAKDGIADEEVRKAITDIENIALKGVNKEAFRDGLRTSADPQLVANLLSQIAPQEALQR